MADTLRNKPGDAESSVNAVPMVASASPSWARAAGVSVLTLTLLVVAFFYVPQFMLTKLSSPPRGVRVWMATAWMAFAFALACYSAWRTTAASARRR